MGELSTKSPVAFAKILGEDYDDGQIVMTIAGTISKLYSAKTGTTSKGDWEFQNAKMKDAEGTEIDISFSKNTQPMTASGKKVTIRSSKTEAHGWNGIKVEDQNYTPQGKTETVQKRVLKITSSAEIIYESGGASSQPEKSGTAGQAKLSGEQASGGGKWTGGSAPFMPWDIHPETALDDLVKLHVKVKMMADQMYPIGKKEGEVTPEFHQSAVATLYIESCRQGLQVNFGERIAKPVPPKILPPPSDPKDWKICQVPKGTHMGKTLDEIDEETLTKYYDSVIESGKESALNNCVKAAFEGRGFLKARQDREAKQKADDEAMNAPADDDIPFD